MHETDLALGLFVVGGALWVAMALLRQENGWFKAYAARITLGLVIGRLAVEALHVGWGFQPSDRPRASVWLVIFCLPLIHALAIEARLTYQAMVVADYAKLLVFVPAPAYNPRHLRMRPPVAAFNT